MKTRFDLRSLMPGSSASKRGNVRANRTVHADIALGLRNQEPVRDPLRKLRVDPTAVSDLEAALAGCLLRNVIK